MPTFPAIFDLATIDGTNGFRISGAAATDWLGFSTASADLNHDGIDDLVLTALFATGSVAYAGAVYVLYGGGAFGADVTLSQFTGTAGLKINGETGNDGTGRGLFSAGDINGDGVEDLIIGAYGADPHGGASGQSYVVFGQSGGLPSTIDLLTLNGANGFQLNGVAFIDFSGFTVSGAGDVNGDGVDDLIISGRYADNTGSDAGGAYVVFGHTDAFTANFELSSLNGANGFRIDGAAAGDEAGFSVSSAGDVNGDGIDDLLVGARHADPNGNNSGAAYVVFGKDTAVVGQFGSTLALSSLNGANGFKLSGPAAGAQAGFSVGSAGDMNGDGIDDLVVGANAFSSYAGAAYVVFGKTTGFAANINLASLDGSNGFRFLGGAFSVAGEQVTNGDINGDGLSDLVVTARSASFPGRSNPGAAFVLFGSRSAFAASYSPTDLNGDNGFQVEGVLDGPVNGMRSVRTGDINGDGYDDLLIGLPYANAGSNQAGYAYVVYGRAGPVTFTGGAGDETANGGGAADNLSGGGGKDTLNGLAGDDLIDGGDGNDLLNGGDGADDLIGGLGGDTLYGDAGADELSGGDGADKLYGGTGADLLNGGTGNDRMDGQSDIDTLNGGAGNDYLDGGLGADIMSGGTENDVYIVDDAGDQTIELPGEGYDIVRTTLNWVLADNLEGLELQASTDASGTGNSGANNLQGNAGANTLSGLAGVDTINGNDGDDIVIGGQGNDLLRGGTGADTFRVEHAFSGALETDQIYDFSTAEGDIMDFSDAFAGTIAKVSAFTHVAGQMTLTFASGITTVRLDIDGNGTAEYQAKINGDVTADYGGWLL